jgi:xylulokinase
MRDERYVLAIDMGSSSVKATLVSRHGELAGTGLRNLDILLLPGGGAEQDPEQWWNAVIAAAQSALAGAAIPPERIVAVACTTQWAVTVPVDAGGHAIWNALSWMDTRGGRYSRAAVDGWPKIEGYAVSKLLKWVRLTGAAPNHSGVDGFGHILYFKHERPDLYARTYKFLEPMDYLNFRLTGHCAASYSTIFPYWVTDNRNPNHIDYHAGLLRASGIERERCRTCGRSTRSWAN